MKAYKSVDDYIDNAPKEAHPKLLELRKLIKETAPEAVEGISYGMPGYKLNGALVYFGGYKTHIGFYPTSANLEKEVKGLAKYRTGKGTLQFPLNEPLPVDLIKKAIKVRVKQNSLKK